MVWTRLEKYRMNTYEPAPAGALDGSGGGVELLLEGIEGAPSLEDSLLERAFTESTAVALALGGGGREVLPEERMVDVTCAQTARSVTLPVSSNRTKPLGCARAKLTSAVELERGLEGDALLRGGSLGVGLLGGVERVHVGLVVLLVVKLHDLLGDEGLERIVAVREVGENVGHGDGVYVVSGGGRLSRACASRKGYLSHPNRL